MKSLKSIAPALILAFAGGCTDGNSTQTEKLLKAKQDPASVFNSNVMQTPCVSDVTPRDHTLLLQSLTIKAPDANSNGFTVANSTDPQKRFFSCESIPVNPMKTVDLECTSASGKNVYSQKNWDSAKIESFTGSGKNTLMVSVANYDAYGATSAAGYKVQPGDTCTVSLAP